MPDDGQLRAEHAQIVIDEMGTIIRVGAEDLAQRHIHDVRAGIAILDRIHPGDRDIAALLIARASRGEGGPVTVELRWSRPNDRWSKILTAFEAAGRAHIRLTLRYDDVVSLRRSEEQMRRVVEGSAQGIIVRTSTEVLYMNESFAKLVGFASTREFRDAGTAINEGIHPDDLPIVMKHMEARIRGEEAVSHYEFRLMHRDGTPIWVEVHAANANWNGKSASLSWMTDISQRKAMEEESLRSKEAAEYANRTKTQFLANMSHELRTPLNAILGFSELIQREMFGPVGEKYLGYAADIHGSGRHLLELVNDVLDLSKLEAGKLELRETEFSVPALVEECLVLVRNRANEAGVRLSSEIPATLPKLRADARSVKQLLLNFLSNAVKFTHEGGEVHVRAACDPRSGLSLCVSDTGIGMSAEEIEVALSPFGQVDSKLARKNEGTGLGLPICRSLMELHGGDFTVTSTPNAGTTLTARFPTSRIVKRELAWAAR
jgi:PAS domain S-box-containing protein